ncbi:hypothetical protein BDQ12DRAFT_685647 [Crucibulum laeve]|uniref:Cupredoxin n=1 Tax=Crucibulum laeve TaxID=68775 RepID=A0A5C3LZM1_9AGAR|nr:hypothetical protein BDQ12DRAFT_685647 [Crucibulum laeve]
MFRFLSAILFTGTFVCTIVLGQNTHMVTVGIEGSFYNPNAIIAQVNDTVTFVFGGDIHTVTQGSFNSPCVPLPGGFSSGFAGRGANFSDPTPTWDLHITNLQPIWFFCEATRPSSHCQTGMVGVINPPGNATIDEFIAAARNVTSMPSGVATPVLTGQGAFATNSPTVPTTSVPFLSVSAITSSSSTPSSASTTSDPSTSSSSTSTSTSFPSPTQAPASGSSTSHIPAIIGGAVGGAVLIILIIALFIIFCRRYRRNHSASNRFFRYKVGPKERRPSDAFIESRLVAAGGLSGVGRGTTETHMRSASGSSRFGDAMVRAPVTTNRPATGNSLNNGGGSISSGTALIQPNRYVADSGDRLNTTDIARQASFASVASTSAWPATAASTAQQQQPDIDIRALANEVAAVLASNPQVQAPVPQQPQQRVMPSANVDNPRDNLMRKVQTRYVANDSMESRGGTPAPPPNYRAALSTNAQRSEEPVW